MDTLVAKAFDLAKSTAPIRGARVAAVIYRRNRILSCGTNSRKSSPFQKKYARNAESICFHAEVAAIKRALNSNISLDACNMLVVRAKKSPTGMWQYGMAKPCAGCQTCIAAFGLQAVFYTTDKGNLEKLDATS